MSRHLNGLTLLWAMRRRGQIIARQFEGQQYDLLICESSLDQAVVLGRIADKQLLDLPSPFADELMFAGHLSAAAHRRIRALEEDCMRSSDRFSYHWPSYEQYAKANYATSARWLECSYGVEQKELRARFACPLRVVFLGSLSGPWVNLPLLERLSALYPHLDVWGGPPPAGPLAARYRGYAPSLDILASYQVGLVTLTDDLLRRSSFSSKQLEYMSYGLPVLVPAWRSDALLAPGTTPYKETTFLEELANLSNPANWAQASARSIALASQLSWDSAFSQLTEYLCQ
jgi:hypothetical protein